MPKLKKSPKNHPAKSAQISRKSTQISAKVHKLGFPYCGHFRHRLKHHQLKRRSLLKSYHRQPRLRLVLEVLVTEDRLMVMLILQRVRVDR